MASEDVKLKDLQSLFSVEGKVAVVTGGSRGLGLHSASALLQAGASKVYITSRKTKACEEAVAALNALPNLKPGAKAISVPSDLATVEGVQLLLSQVQQTTDHVDILLANAGATWGEKFETHPDAAFAKVMNLNVKSVFNTIQAFTPLLTKNCTKSDPSRVIITASVAGLSVPMVKQGVYGYAASKAAVIHLGRSLALELGPRNITVNSVAPGFFPSKMSDGLLSENGGYESLSRENPLGRLGMAEDMAGAILYLTSRAGAYVNGEVITIDGGSMWQRADIPSSKL